MQGIENNLNHDDSLVDTHNDVNRFPGLEETVSVFEEILVWPSQYPDIFNNSPLRNQAGILLFGASGVGKTYLVSQIARYWNLRVISVKGPELLAKFIGDFILKNIYSIFSKNENIILNCCLL